MKAYIQTVAYWLIQAAPYAIAIVPGMAMKGCV